VQELRRHAGASLLDAGTILVTIAIPEADTTVAVFDGEPILWIADPGRSAV
jgi:hypothetical protein